MNKISKELIYDPLNFIVKINVGFSRRGRLKIVIVFFNILEPR